MELGIGLPTMGRDTSPEAIGRVAESAERIGLAGVWAGERLLRPAEPMMIGVGPLPLPDFTAVAYDPLETLSFVAATTRRVRLGTSVTDALFQSPIVMARRLATLDCLSGGRLMIGLGQGWMAQEFIAAGVSPKRRGAGFEEHIRAMRAVWGPDPVRFEGQFYKIPESEIGPKPSHPDGPTLLAGAGSPVAMERAVRLGLGLTTVVFAWEGLRERLAMFRRAVEAAGRDPRSLPIVLHVNGSVTSKPLDERAPLTGSVEQVAGDLSEVNSLGADHVFWSLYDDADEQLGAMERLLEEMQA
jgi:probable F420-dependent oxidoreductase